MAPFPDQINTILLSTLCNFSYCNETHSSTSLSKKFLVKKILPSLFQDDLLCAGTLVGNQGACKGDSGGPLMIRNLSSRKWTQIGIVHGAIGECGDIDYPAIFIRLNHPSVRYFITSVVEGKRFLSGRISPPMVFLKSKNSIALINVTDKVSNFEKGKVLCIKPHSCILSQTNFVPK